jgi:hypothetical protein
MHPTYILEVEMDDLIFGPHIRPVDPSLCHAHRELLLGHPSSYAELTAFPDVARYSPQERRRASGA